MGQKLKKKKINKLHTQFEKKIDTVYRNLLNNMNLNDQMIRKDYVVNWDMVRKVDLENDSILKNKLNTIGFPTLRKVGNYKKLSFEKISKNVSLDAILIHLSVDNEIFESYKKMLFEYVKKGYLLPNAYANMVDKNYYTNHKKSYYHFMFSNHQHTMDLKTKNEINSKRKLVGLPCLDYYNLFTEKRIFNN